jgi:ribonuclease HI
MSFYYVVHKGRKTGIYHSWNECKKQIDHFEGAIFKKFTNEEEAKEFLKNGFGEGKKPKGLVRKENDDKKNQLKIKKETGENDLEESSIEKIFIYTDGSCMRLKNKLVKAGFGIYIPEKNIEISAPLLNQKLTNNRAEMTAIIDSIKYLDDYDLSKKICIFTDSQYSMYIFNGTGERYEKDGYKNNGVDVPNIDLIKKMLELKRKYNIVLLKVRAHTEKKDEHSIGNKIADKLANDGALTTVKENNIFLNIHADVDIDKNNSEINKDIQMNELFEFEESTIDNNKNTIKKKNLKNQKLSNWFIAK